VYIFEFSKRLSRNESEWKAGNVYQRDLIDFDIRADADKASHNLEVR